MTQPEQREPGTWLLDRIDAREQALTSQIVQTQAQIEELAGRLRDLDQDLDHLRITRKTLLVLAAGPDLTPPPPASSGPRPPGLPADSHHPDRHRPAPTSTGPVRRPGPPLARKNIENTRAKLNRLVGLGILAEIEPGLFAQPRP